MCAGCRSSSQGASEDLNAKPFGTLSDGSMGDAGVAMKANDKFDGSNSQNEKYELSAPSRNASATAVANVGRQ
jgi:hypothetical protein